MTEHITTPPAACRVYWGSHGCDLPAGHANPPDHLCTGWDDATEQVVPCSTVSPAGMIRYWDDDANTWGEATPHLVAVHAFDDITELVGRDLAVQARRTYAECVAAGEWPGYPDEVITTAMPGWWLGQLDDDLDDMEII